MARNMSFKLTTRQMRARTKTVTRRMGWWNVKPGEVIQACVQCQGLRKGQTIEVITRIRVLGARAEPLAAISLEECVREGFPELSPRQFMSLFMTANPKARPETIVNRIEFEYIEETKEG